jgi:hypothetical protein
MQQRILHLSPFLFLLSSFLMIGCKSKEPATAASAPAQAERSEMVAEAPAILASIERTSCFGSCPIYKATFFDNGEVTYVGKNFVENIGTYTTLVSAEDLEGIVQMAKDVNYFALEDAYPTPIADFPKTITSVNLKGNQKSILNGENAPRDLIGFERYLDGLLKDREWTKVSDSRSY